ncbi:MarR family winged helix-turn-helix transcriptional regulator [Enterococcus sp. AZ192]|uniref:MarR family winged helix-turn-helix transcriptional regulator n=1 Tax=unclassified Enterococcus TaxID=2608891 RepID=UPI003D2E76B4
MVIKQNDVVSSFIELTERIANSKTNILDFGSKEMTFYRGEIHMIKMVGDYPGIYSSEIARKFGITRAVVHKTLIKLQERKLITKEIDSQDKKRFRLYLTTKGKEAYESHEAYHQKFDQALFSYLDNLSASELTVIDGFLKEASHLVENHA